MSYTTHEKIRLESGFQGRYIRQAFKNSPDGISANVFYVKSDEAIKFVPNFGTGNTVAGISDIQVYLGLSGIYGVSLVGASAIDIDQGSIKLSFIPNSGVSLTISYASSALSSREIEDVRIQAEGMVNQRVAICYSMPLSVDVPELTSIATRLASALLLIRSYGVGGRNLSQDGYALYNKIIGGNQQSLANGSRNSGKLANVGELGLICSAGSILVDSGGVIVKRNDQDVQGDVNFIPGGRINGRLYDITEEPFRAKPWQLDTNRDQPGSGVYPTNNNIDNQVGTF